MNNSYLIGRQPILNCREEIVAYELLFRSAYSISSARVRDATHATSRVIFDTLSCFGIQDLLGPHKAFINVDLDMLMSDVIELFPPRQVVLELLENIAVTPEVIARCQLLRSKGYLLALDDHKYDLSYLPFYEGLADIIKIDLFQTSITERPVLLDNLRPYPVIILAEKVDTRGVYLHCRRLGFDLFQGYFFARPSLIQKQRMQTCATAFLQLMQKLSNDAPFREIEQIFKGSPTLTYKLLKLVNSVLFGFREKIRTIGHALTMLGFKQLKRWVQIAVFAADSNDENNPIVDTAAVRAVFMEELARLHPETKLVGSAPEEAFMVGILSLLKDIYEFPMSEIVTGLNLTGDIRNALTDRAGNFGAMLSIVEMIEWANLDEAAISLKRLGISLDSVLACQKKAYNWRGDNAGPPPTSSVCLNNATAHWMNA